MIVRRIVMTKLWQDKTDEEFKADIMKMVEEGKLTKWNPWDHIKTLDEAKDYVEAIYEEWFEESDAANDCIVEILESYMEVLNLLELTVKKNTITPQIQTLATTLCKERKKKWQPVLDDARKTQKARKSAK